MSSPIGGYILAVLREKQEPITFRALLKDIASSLDVPSSDIKEKVLTALQVGLYRGFVQKCGHRFFVKDEFPDEEIKEACDLVMNRGKKSKSSEMNSMDSNGLGQVEKDSKCSDPTMESDDWSSDEESISTFDKQKDWSMVDISVKTDESSSDEKEISIFDEHKYSDISMKSVGSFSGEKKMSMNIEQNDSRMSISSQ